MVRLNLPIRRARIGVLNFFHHRKHVPRYVLIALNGEVSEIPPQRWQTRIPFVKRFLPPDPPSVSSLRRMLEQIALDPRVEGVVLKIECMASAATYQSLRTVLLDFRARGKRLIAYANSFGPFQYYLACACDQIIMAPSAEWGVTGFLREYLFYKDALGRLGIGVDVINVSPYKSAFDEFVRTDFSEESRKQAEWLLSAQFDELVRGIAEGRKLTPEQVRALIDAAPYGAREAVSLGLLDATLYEDELETYLTPKVSEPPADKSKTKPQRALELYDEVAGALLIPYISYAPKLIGVVRVEGTIMEGKSRNLPVPVPLFGNRFSGAETVAQALRNAAQDEQIAAVVLYVDSSGGGVLASDLIAREVRKVREKKPVIAYMGGVAASGGYYVSALAQRIIAQPLTITGSIGVISMKPNLQRAESKLLLHNVTLKRGERAGIFSTATPLDADGYAAVASTISRAYDDFKRLVAEGRKLNVADLEPISGGRVWTGAMARERGLVDELGDFTLAVQRARELAGLPADRRARVVNVMPPHKFMLPTLPTPSALAGLDGLDRFTRMLARVHTWAILPWQPPMSD
jgi:protease-4